MDPLARPYYIEYRVTDMEGYTAEAAFGALRFEQTMRSRFARVVVRIGDYKQDSYFGGGQGIADVFPIEDDLLALRQVLWLATDSAYKAAGEALSAKQAQLKQLNVDEPVDDFAHAAPLESIEPLAKLDMDAEHWRSALADSSGMFRLDPEIQAVSTSLRFTAVNQYFINSEGTVTRHGSSQYLVTLEGAAQAPDGMYLQRSPYFASSNPKDLPAADKIIADTKEMVATLAALQQAPIMEEEYRGPVLFSGDAASDVIADLVANNVRGQKPRLGAPSRTVGAYSTSYKVRVLPAFVSITDDPTLETFGGQSLLGHYTVDDEGVKAAPVTVIQDGQLVNYLLGREPIRDFPNSNGHSRAAPGQSPSPSIGVLMVQAKETSSPAELEKKMLDLCREQQKPYGYLATTLGPRFAPRLLYRVWVKDGHRELVRGAVFNELDPRELRNSILALGNDPYVSNRAGPVATTIISPSILFDELEVKRSETSKEKLPAYPAPPISKKR